MRILDWTGFSATPAGWMNSSNHSGGVANAQPPANFWQPFGLSPAAADMRRRKTMAEHNTPPPYLGGDE